MTSAIKEQKFLDELDKKLWTAADKLRSNLDAAGLWISSEGKDLVGNEL